MLSLRSPDYGNTVTLETGVLNVRSQDGDLVQIYDAAWGHEDSFNLTFSGLAEEEKWNFIEFYKNTVGHQVTFRDHELRNWLGYFTSKLVFKQTGPGCQYSCSFSFLGTLLP